MYFNPAVIDHIPTCSSLYRASNCMLCCWANFITSSFSFSDLLMGGLLGSAVSQELVSAGTELNGKWAPCCSWSAPLDQIIRWLLSRFSLHTCSAKSCSVLPGILLGICMLLIASVYACFTKWFRLNVLKIFNLSSLFLRSFMFFWVQNLFWILWEFYTSCLLWPSLIVLIQPFITDVNL